MPEETIRPLARKCRICGGNLVNDYMSASCVCENCGNRWAMTDMIPKLAEYSHITDKIRRALEMIADSQDRVSLSQAQSLFKSAEAECLKNSNEVTSDLLKICNDGQTQISLLMHYSLGKDCFEKKNYTKARSEFEKVKDYKDSGSYMERCDIEIAALQKKRIPFAIIVGMVLPAVLSIALHETVGLHIGICIPIFLVVSLLLAYGIYRGGIISFIVEIISFSVIVPLLLFLLLAYGFHMQKTIALIISIGAPILLGIVISIVSGGKN